MLTGLRDDKSEKQEYWIGLCDIHKKLRLEKGAGRADFEVWVTLEATLFRIFQGRHRHGEFVLTG